MGARRTDIFRRMSLASLLRVLPALLIAVPAAPLFAGDPPTPPPAEAAKAEPPKEGPKKEEPKKEDPKPIDPGPLAPEGFSLATADRIATVAKLAPSRVVQIAVSRGEKPIQAVLFGNPDPAKKLPAMLLVGGMDGVNFASTEQVFAALEAIAKDNPKIFESMRVYAIPEANPDARAWAAKHKATKATNARAVDSDRDGVADEDGPRDINGDGFVTMMRRVAPPGRTATQVVDAADARIVRGANRDKNETATHEIFVEGADTDGDGLFAEDADGGVDLDRNFPHRWPEGVSEAGPYQLSEPESLGIAKFVRDHPEIVTAVVFGRHDTVAAFPDTKDKDSTGRTPQVYHEEDHAIYRDFSKLWKESTKLEHSDNADLAGSLVLWLADHRGIAAVAANGWTRPEAPKLPEGTPAPAETGDGDQAAWLAVSDRLYGGRGFVAWKPFKHPKLGDVEIGGFAPFFKSSPTAVEAKDLAAKSAPFVVALAGKRPELAVSDAVVTPLANGLARIEMRVTNKGTLTTMTEMGRITQVRQPIIVRLPLKPEEVFTGKSVEKIDRLLPGASVEYSWVVHMPASGSLDITVNGPYFDTITRTAKGAAR